MGVIFGFNNPRNRVTIHRISGFSYDVISYKYLSISVADPDLKVRWARPQTFCFCPFTVWVFYGVLVAFVQKIRGGRGPWAPPLDLPLHLVRHTRRDKYIKHRPFEVNRKFIKLDCVF